MSLPGLELYYLTAQLQWLAKWKEGDNSSELGNEGTERNVHVLVATLLQKGTHRERDYVLLTTALKCWGRVTKRMKQTPLYALGSPW